MFSFIKKIVFTVVAVALLLFLYQNMEPLSQTIGFSVDLYAEGLNYATPRFPVFFMFLAAFLLGTILIGFHGIYERLARKTEIRLRNRKIKALEKEVGALKSELSALQKPLATLKEAEGAKASPESSASAIIAQEKSQPVADKPVVAKPALTPLEEEPTL